MTTIKTINAVKNLNAGKITQTSSANSGHKHCEIEHFSTLNERIISHAVAKIQKTSSLSITSVTCIDQLLYVISRQY